MLLVAEAANPEWASVPLVGWSLASAIAAQTDAHIVTQVRNREAFLRAGLVEGEDFTAINTEHIERPLWQAAKRLGLGEKGGWTLLAAMSSFLYPYFERQVWKKFGDRIRAREFDMVHRITPVMPTAAGVLAERCQAAGIPFMLGPINGGVPWPKGFADLRTKEREWLSMVRGFYRLNPTWRRMLKASNVILCGSGFALAGLPERYRAKAILMPENGIDPSRFTRVAVQDGSLPLRACFIGRLVPYKAAALAIEAAIPFLASGQMTFDIIGDGPEREALEAQVAAAGLGQVVTFHGWLDHRQVQDVAVRNQILLFPSIREFGGGVVLEAMALGLVPVVVNYAGPGELVDSDVGLKVPIADAKEITVSLRGLLGGLISDPSVLAKKSEAGRLRIKRNFLWSAKATRIIEIASSVAARETSP
ncbi:glycosyltransferase family 4 protein [Paracoccus benzoatiresistens]|uniref:Glycosyltransferase family 4 protein n=1 Tax=Paracoccus benzoatiresistens TaxID=2997341 RepID=A0ABT4J868_9RHOB|nr:glycosyltransferase family 4 protein [Paracoccus sp. EF6]MCZ0963315.1 glycosyltransferase family 4 protein [Paracoccus sp. EF6]